MLSLIFKKNELREDTKNRILKAREPVLDKLSELLDGNKCCPFMLGQPCMGKACMLFIEFFRVDANGEQKKFWNCSFAQQPSLTIEGTNKLNALIEVLNRGKMDENIKAD